LTLSGESDARALFSTVRHTRCDVTLTIRSLLTPESQFSSTWRCEAMLLGKGDSRLPYSGIDEIPEVTLRRLKSRFDSRDLRVD
jgi:hypothetical protein